MGAGNRSLTVAARTRGCCGSSRTTELRTRADKAEGAGKGAGHRIAGAAERRLDTRRGTPGGPRHEVGQRLR